MGQSSCWGLRIRFVEPRFSGIQWNKGFPWFSQADPRRVCVEFAGLRR